MTEAERERIRAESRRLLEADGSPVPPPVREDVRIPEPPDPVQEWREWHDARDVERQAAKAELRRKERAMHTEYEAGVDVRLVELERRLVQRLAAVEQRLEAFDAVANGTVTFSNAVTERLEELASLAHKVDKALETMRHVHARECDALRDRLAASEASHSRETAMLVKQLSDAQRELDVRANLREHAANRMAVAGVNETLENVVSLVREDLRERKR
jgi:hypothetical protein